MPRARFQNTTFRSAFIKKKVFNLNFNHITSVLWEEKQKRLAWESGLVNSSWEAKQQNLRFYV